MRISKTKLERGIGKKICVVGDIILDKYIWGEVKRVSPEAPVPLVDVKKKSYILGGAANVAANLKELGADVSIIGVVSSDSPGRLLSSLLKGMDSGIVIDDSRITSVKTRVMAQGQQLLRYDKEETNSLIPATEKEILDRIKACDAELYILSDYNKGFFSKKIVEAIKAKGKVIIADPKPKNILMFKGVDVVTPNVLEAQRITKVETGSDTDMIKMGFKLKEMLGADSIISRGAKGIFLYTKDQQRIHPTTAQEVYDVTGAGDTLIATLGFALISEFSLAESASIANHAAGIKVGKIGTATISIGEIVK